MFWQRFKKCNDTSPILYYVISHFGLSMIALAAENRVEQRAML